MGSSTTELTYSTILACSLTVLNPCLICASLRSAQLICLAGVLETAIKLSPYNYHFKLIGLQVYGALTAFERGCGLFNGLGVKNIQLDSLSYVLLDGLLKSGLFCEALKQSQDIQGMHLHSQRSLSDHLGKAYMYGNYSQVVDMLDFQKNKMAKSLQLFSR